jgi:hypothetical protein
MALTVGRMYSREEIREEVGGGDLQSYLPYSEGRVLGGCFDPGLNARAPFEIDVGDLPKVTQYAQLLVQQGHEIPVFLKRGSKAWEYVGRFRAVRYNTDPDDLYPRQPRRTDAVAVLYLARSDDETTEAVSDDSSFTSQAAAEGGRSLVQHLRQERSRALVDAKRRSFRERHGHLRCEACGLSEASLPSDIGEACFEVHHAVALASRQTPQLTRIDDLALVCANCHRMIHRASPMLTVEQLRARFGTE